MIKSISNLFEGFRRFVSEYKVLGLLVAFVLGVALKDITQAIIAYLIMPVIDPLIKNGTWQTASFNIGPVIIQWGAFLKAFLDFLIIVIVVYVLVKVFKKRIKSKR